MTKKWKFVAIILLPFFLTIAGYSDKDKSDAAPMVSKNIFQPSAIDPVLVRQCMQARSEYEGINRKVIALMNKVYEENPEIKELQAKMRELQKKIDALLAEDEELNKLKKNFRSIAPDIPIIPRRNIAPASTNAISRGQKPEVRDQN